MRVESLEDVGCLILMKQPTI